MRPERTRWMLERLRLGELPEPLCEELKKSPETEAKLASLLAADAEFFVNFPPERWVPRIREGLSRPRRPAALRGVLLFAAVATCATVVLALRGEQGGGEGLRAKGLKPSLTVYRSASGGAEQLAEGAVVRAGDLLQLVYLPAGRPYGAIVSADGTGAVTPHFPEHARVAAPLQRGAEVKLQSGYRLDAAPRFERFWFVTSSEPFPLEPVLAAARRAAAESGERLQLPAPLEQFTFTLRKAP
jgi:hypothetical protein